MTGAGEYAVLFDSGKYGNFRIDSGEHARGYYFHIFICTSEGEQEVYGILGGHPGWNEYYGWLYHGPWEKDFKELVEKQKIKITIENEKRRRTIENRKKEIDEKIVKILNAYGR